MARVKICGARCHEAVTIHCTCWCQGAFHGEKSECRRKNWRGTIGAQLPWLIPALESGKIKYKEVTKNVDTEHKMS